MDSLSALLDELDRELGPPSDEDYAWADRALGLELSVDRRAGRPADDDHPAECSGFPVISLGRRITSAEVADVLDDD